MSIEQNQYEFIFFWRHPQKHKDIKEIQNSSKTIFGGMKAHIVQSVFPKISSMFQVNQLKI